jgi:hypothetical protein
LNRLAVCAERRVLTQRRDDVVLSVGVQAFEPFAAFDPVHRRFGARDVFLEDRLPALAVVVADRLDLVFELGDALPGLFAGEVLGEGSRGVVQRSWRRERQELRPLILKHCVNGVQGRDSSR